MRARSFALLLTWVALCVSAACDAAEEVYKIQPGDVLNITVAPQAEYGRTVTVQPDGKVNYPVAGELQAAGRTLADFRKELTKGLERELNNPAVTVSLQTAAAKPAPQLTVLGAVRTPGLFEVRPGWRLTEAIAAAGGPAPTADLSRVTITRVDRTLVTADLTPAAAGSEKNNPEVRQGDLVLVLEGTPQRPTVTILGEVTRPGAFELLTDMTVLELLTAAGGPTPKANLRRVTFARGSATGVRSVDLEALLRGDGADGNFKLEARDTLIIPENHQRVVVIGEVAQQGEVALEGGETVLDLLIRAGGPSASAELSKATILRRGADGKPQSIQVNLKKLMTQASGGRKADVPQVASGDLLFVPPRNQKQQSDWMRYLTPLGLVFSLFGF